MKKSLLLVPLLSLLIACGGGQTGNQSQDGSSIEQSSISSVEENSNVIDLIVLAGQSNMEGHSEVSKLLTYTLDTMHGYYTDGFANTQIWYHCNNGSNKNEGYEPVKIGMGFDKTRFGPEVGIAQKLQTVERERPLYIVKYALGATSLATDWKSPTSGGNNSLYHKMLNFLYDAILYWEELGKEVSIKALFWMQGEADSMSNTQTEAYYDNLVNFVGDFRDELEGAYGDPERGIAFVDAGISDCETWTNQEAINAAKKEFAESDPTKNYYFDTMEEGLEYRYDNQDYFHYDATSEIKLGELFITQLLENNWL